MYVPLNQIKNEWSVEGEIWILKADEINENIQETIGNNMGSSSPTCCTKVFTSQWSASREDHVWKVLSFLTETLIDSTKD